MRYISLFLLTIFVFIFAQSSYAQQESQIESLTLEGGPIFSEHFQSGDPGFNEHHGLGIAKIHTRDYGNWGLYVLSPNSVDDTSVGVGYVTNPYTIPLGPTSLELSAALGLVTGYQDYPVPLIAGEARLGIYESNDEKWNIGVAMALSPYFAKSDRTGDNEFGVVATSPFLSVRYQY